MGEEMGYRLKYMTPSLAIKAGYINSLTGGPSGWSGREGGKEGKTCKKK